MPDKKFDKAKGFERLLKRCKNLDVVKTAVIHPCSEGSLLGSLEAAEHNLIDPVLIGPASKILATAAKYKIDISQFDIVDVPHSHAAAEAGVAMVREGKAGALMKGSLHTDELMHAVLNKSTGLRTERRISHAFVIAIENYHKPFIVTDAAINIYPDLMTKRDIVQNAIDLFKTFDITATPKVAILSAIETVNPVIQSTIDAACLTVMAARKQITGGIVDGPLAYDNAFSLEAAQIKGIESEVAGDPDIFVAPDLEAGNILAKQLVLTSNAGAAGILLGARVPIMLTSRADGVRSRVGSCAIAVLMAHAQREQEARLRRAA